MFPRGRLVAVLTVFAMSALLLPTSASATYLGQNGRIAFIQNGDIYMVNPDGTDVANLTNGFDADANHISVSPDGRYIAFTTEGYGDLDDAGVYVMNSNGGGLMDLTSYDEDLIAVQDPTWSPDSKRIAFEAYDYDFKNELWVVDVDGSDIERVTNCGCVQNSSPQWSPIDKNVIVFDYYEEIWTVNPNTGASQKIIDDLYKNSSGLTFSPDGQSFVFDDLLDIWTIRVDGTGLRQLTPDNSAYYIDPAYSPDGTRIIFTSSHGGSDGGLFSIAADGIDATISPVYDGLGSQRQADWGPMCEEQCDFVNLSLVVKTQRSKVKAAGSVTPPVPGQKVTVTLLKANKAGELSEAGTKNVTLKNASTYSAVFKRAKGKACAIVVEYPGDAQHAPASAFHVFKC